MTASVVEPTPTMFGMADGPESAACQSLRASARRRLSKAYRLQREADRALADAVALFEAAGPGTAWFAAARRLNALVDLCDLLVAAPSLYDDVLSPSEVDELVARHVARIGGRPL